MQTNLAQIESFTSPNWCFNGHIHTITRSFSGDTQKPPVKRTEITTPDGDFLEIDLIIHPNNKPVIALFHGLEGSSNRYYMIELMKKLSSRGFAVAAVNFRSCGSRMNRKKRFYHSGETDDIRTVFNWLGASFPNRKSGAVGFSLGGNALLKFLAENHPRKPETAVAVSVPYNLKKGSLKINKGFNRIYEYRFLRTLRKKLNKKRKQFPGLPRFTGSSLYDFDDQVTSRIHGFKNAEEYYRKCSSAQFVTNIETRVLLVHSKEDPLCPISEMPVDVIMANPFTDFIITERGGHVGFRSKPSGWLNNTIIDYLKS